MLGRQSGAYPQHQHPEPPPSSPEGSILPVDHLTVSFLQVWNFRVPRPTVTFCVWHALGGMLPWLWQPRPLLSYSGPSKILASG